MRSAPGNPLRNFWAFVAGVTNVRVELTIIDTESGAVRRFFNGLGQPFFTPAADSPDGKANPPGAILATTEALGAFPTCDVAATGTATAGQDYTAVGGTLNWANGDAADKSFNIPILDDLNSEAAETLSIALSQPSGATLGSPAAATLTTFDNGSVPPCVDGEFQVCLLGRFLANIHWVRPNNQGQGEGRVTRLTDSAASFEFFEPGNVEVVLKMKDACALPGRQSAPQLLGVRRRRHQRAGRAHHHRHREWRRAALLQRARSAVLHAGGRLPRRQSESAGGDPGDHRGAGRVPDLRRVAAITDRARGVPPSPLAPIGEWRPSLPLM